MEPSEIVRRYNNYKAVEDRVIDAAVKIAQYKTGHSPHNAYYDVRRVSIVSTLDLDFFYVPVRISVESYGYTPNCIVKIPLNRYNDLDKFVEEQIDFLSKAAEETKNIVNSSRLAGLI